jgi:extradiol dioxygenase family protein
MTARPPVHLAFPVTSLANARKFYGELLGCPGRALLALRTYL